MVWWVDILFGDGLGHTSNASLCKRIVDLTSISVHARGGRDVDDVPGLAVLDTEVWCSSTNDLEGCGCVKINNGVPLLVGHLVDDTVPCIASVVDNDVDLAVAKFGGFLDESLDVVVVENITADCNGLAATLLDLLDYAVCLFCLLVSGFSRRKCASRCRVSLLASTSATTTFAPSFANSLAASAPMP